MFEPRLVLSSITLTDGTLAITLAESDQNLAVYSNETADTLVVAVDGVPVDTFLASHVDFLHITGNAQPNTVDLSGLALGAVMGAWVDLGTGNDTVIGSMSADSIFGGEGDDLIFSGGRPDSVDGGAGNDTISGNGGNDSITGGIGDDSLLGQMGQDSIDGGTGQDALLTGGDVDDVVSDPTDTLQDVSLFSSDVTVRETQGVARVTIRLSDMLTESVTVTVATFNITATASEDYEPLAETIVTFSSGETEQTIEIPIFDGLDDEANESFSLQLTNVTQVALLTPQVLINILNVAFNPAKIPTVGMYGDQYAVSGGNGATIEVAITDQQLDFADIDVGLEIQLIPGSAVAADIESFDQMKNQTVPIRSGIRFGEFVRNYKAVGDNDARIETFVVRITPSNRYNVVTNSTRETATGEKVFSEISITIVPKAGIALFGEFRTPLPRPDDPIRDETRVYYDDVNQGGQSNCHCAGALAALARNDPQYIEGALIKEVGTGPFRMFQVFLWDIRDTPNGVEIVDAIPGGELDPQMYEYRPTLDSGPQDFSLSGDYDVQGAIEVWPQFVQKAYDEHVAHLAGQATVDTPGNAYAILSGKIPQAVGNLSSLSGDALKNAIATDIASGQRQYFVAVHKLSDFTGSDLQLFQQTLNNTNVIANHTYLIKSVSAAGKIVLWNPQNLPPNSQGNPVARQEPQLTGDELKIVAARIYTIPSS